MPDFDQSLPIILRSQRIFILKTYLMGIGLVALAVLQWLLLTTKQVKFEYSFGLCFSINLGVGNVWRNI